MASGGKDVWKKTSQHEIDSSRVGGGRGLDDSPTDIYYKEFRAMLCTWCFFSAAVDEPMGLPVLSLRLCIFTLR